MLAGADEPSEVSDDDDDDASVLSEDENIENWGTSKKDYYNADVIETEADAKEEETEAIRLQKKHLQRLTEADFGFDESEWLKGEKQDEDDEGNQRGIVQEILPQLEITDSMGPEERAKIMKIRYPEFEPLAKEFVELSALHDDIRLEAEAAKAVEVYSKNRGNTQTGVKSSSGISRFAFAKYAAASAYLGALSMYFAILSSGPDDGSGKRQAMPTIELRDHPIMKTLMECRELWGKAKDVSVPEPAEIAALVQGDSRDEIDPVQDASRDLAESKLIDQPSQVKKKKSGKSKAQLAAEAALIKAENIRAERIRQTEENLKQLSNLRLGSSHLSKVAQASKELDTLRDPDDSDFGEATTPLPADNARRKKTLQFYTSQIAQKANKRGNAGRDAGGDADLPYRERFRDKQSRLNAEAEAKGRRKNASKGEALGGESDEDDVRIANELRERDKDSEEEYYDLVTAQSQKKKADKAARAAIYEQAAKEGGTVVIQEESKGRKPITYTIEKNKGILPNRKKEVRNPRVKKRKKYEEKQKKIGSIRPVYKGGEGRGGYGGELTGIKSGLIRSIKL